MKRDYLINLNTAVDIIGELRHSRKIDRETESLFIDVLYKCREFNFSKNPFKIIPAGETREPIFNIKEFIQLKIESLKVLFLKVESTGESLPRVFAADKIDKMIQSYLEIELDKISAAVLKVRETFIEISKCTDSREMLEVIKQRTN